MEELRRIEFLPGSNEERLPGFAPDFPYTASREELDRYAGRAVAWHWHRPVELFYIESGALEYSTPGGRQVFPAGSGGLVNSNVLHMTRALSRGEPTVQLLHIFDPAFLSGGEDNLLMRKYIHPITASPQLELIPLFPGDSAQDELLAMIQAAFRLPRDRFGHEFQLRQALCEIWLRLLPLARPTAENAERSRSSGKVKQMMAYIYEHYSEPLSVSQLAAAAFLSERECYRVFQTCLHTTPAAYLRSYRLQRACALLEQDRDSITAIGHACALGSSSYFGKVFRETIGCTPSEYRRKWQDLDS